MFFETKKVKTETLPEYLRLVRTQKGVDLETVAVKCKTVPKFLYALENGFYGDLPPEVYVTALLGRLAKFYEVPARELCEQFQREKQVYNNLSSASLASSKGWKSYISKLEITPKFLRYFFSVAFVFASVIYVVWQVFSINKAPSLKIFEPANNAIIENGYVTLKGQTDPETSLKVNNQMVFVASDGRFEIKLSLADGQSEIKIEARNRFEKSLEKTIRVTGKSSKVNEESFRLNLEFKGPVELVYKLDDSEKNTVLYKAGDTKALNAISKIEISTSNAGATYVGYDNRPLGPMGRQGEVLERILFYPEP